MHVACVYWLSSERERERKHKPKLLHVQFDQKTTKKLTLKKYNYCIIVRMCVVHTFD